jgi:DNA-directed RNA polymerase specialized sigma24 family protein
MQTHLPAPGRQPDHGAVLTAFSSFPEVLAAAQAGAPWALQQLYDGLSGQVLAYCRSRGAAEPEDVTSEVFLSAFSALRDFRGDEQNLRAWVFTIAHRRLMD